MDTKSEGLSAHVPLLDREPGKDQGFGSRLALEREQRSEMGAEEGNAMGMRPNR